MTSRKDTHKTCAAPTSGGRVSNKSAQNEAPSPEGRRPRPPGSASAPPVAMSSTVDLAKRLLPALKHAASILEVAQLMLRTCYDPPRPPAEQARAQEIEKIKRLLLAFGGVAVADLQKPSHIST